jgi:hypothetical protein
LEKRRLKSRRCRNVTRPRDLEVKVEPKKSESEREKIWP